MYESYVYTRVHMYYFIVIVIVLLLYRRQVMERRSCRAEYSVL